MKKGTITLAVMSALTLTGCIFQANQPDNSVAQVIYDTSLEAKKFADALFEGMVEEKDISEYSIDLTSHGFVTDDPLIYIVGYRYTYNGQTTTYGYKMHQTEEGFAVIEEGVEVGEFITGNGGNNEENNGCV